MRFELTVALKYLIPKWRQLSVSIISLISVCVISLVVWLVILFLSVTEGIEKKWVEELVALNAPLRMTPTEAYYGSYYYQIDGVSLDSNYTTKTIGEKLVASLTEPYDERMDRELSSDFPTADRYEDGRLKDLVKDAYEAVQALPYKGIRAQEYEVTYGNLRLQIVRDGDVSEGRQSLLSQVSYIASHDEENARINKMVIPPSASDFNNLLRAISQNYYVPEEGDAPVQEAPITLQEHLKGFFENLEIKQIQTANQGCVLSAALFPKEGKLKALAVVRHHQIAKIIIPKTVEEITSLERKLNNFGHQTEEVALLFDDGQMHISSPIRVNSNVQILLDEKIPFTAKLVQESLENIPSLDALMFQVDGFVQNVPISGQTSFKNLEITSALSHVETEPFWVYKNEDGTSHIPSNTANATLGEPLLVAKNFKKNDVRLGDRGYLAYYAMTGSSLQEQRIPVYVAGFYDPGMIPAGSKLIFVDSKVAAILRSNSTVNDPMLGNGVNIWLNNLKEATLAKDELIKSLKARGIDQYWNVQSYHDYEFTKPILEQLQSDKHLFSLIAIIILIVACSNIISMLILLVNDKKKEIGILQSMGASPLRIATIFGLCGFATGVLSCVIGVTAAIFTLKNLQSLVSFLSFMQGRDAFQTAFYGSSLPNTLSYSVLFMVLIATLAISLLAGIVPAIKAARVRPTAILRSE